MSDPADSLNRDCQCISLDREQLHDNLLRRLGPEHGHLFADLPVFVARQHIDAMELVILAIRALVENPDYQSQVLARAPSISSLEPSTDGVFYGFDFHLGELGPQLIEVNTNAGGALLNDYLKRAQRACCPPVAELFSVGGDDSLEHRFVDMFRHEWATFQEASPGAGARELTRVAIVDQRPEQQFLFPEFQLMAELLVSHGIDALICDPTELVHENGRLYHGTPRDSPIDLVYNRLTDFYLEEPPSGALRSAFESRSVALTPAPWHYALLADKRNLAIFSDREQLLRLGVDQAHLSTLETHVPRTRVVAEISHDDEATAKLWGERKQLFFKPATGHGSRGTYDGKKLTRKVFDQILRQDYVAQNKIPPSLRTMTIDGQEQQLKVDLRALVYRSEIQQISARLYRGQTTNMRTPGGGLATVFTTSTEDRQ